MSDWGSLTTHGNLCRRLGGDGGLTYLLVCVCVSTSGHRHLRVGGSSGGGRSGTYEASFMRRCMAHVWRMAIVRLLEQLCVFMIAHRCAGEAGKARFYIKGLLCVVCTDGVFLQRRRVSGQLGECFGCCKPVHVHVCMWGSFASASTRSDCHRVQCVPTARRSELSSTCVISGL